MHTEDSLEFFLAMYKTMIFSIICTIAQFKKSEKHPWKSFTISNVTGSSLALCKK